MSEYDYRGRRYLPCPQCGETYLEFVAILPEVGAVACRLVWQCPSCRYVRPLVLTRHVSV